MIERISFLLKAKNITPAQLADEIGVQRSGISHILNGRNKPSLDFIHKLIHRYPEISTNWIMFGEGPMILETEKINKTQPEEVKQNNKSSVMDLFKFEVAESEEAINVLANSGEQKYSEDYGIKPITSTTPGEKQTTGIDDHNQDVMQKKDLTNSGRRDVYQKAKKISRIVIFYDDKTFTEYLPGEEESDSFKF